ncbi:hypothetical protein CRG98_032529 [Punica granatum]|uniref:Uncharacterized protein n=1 Tax=Punica granatum TaxID=22663 RepID=A0A2I0ISU1_PUNGR|nr:hypothetical protein CRG98_032529 [Punica granatum]
MCAFLRAPAVEVDGCSRKTVASMLSDSLNCPRLRLRRGYLIVGHLLRRRLELDAGLEPNAVNAGPKTDAGPEPNAVNTGPEPDVGPEPNVVNPGPEPDVLNTGPEPNAESARNAKAKVNVEEQRRALQSGDYDLLAIFVERGWELSVEIPRSWMKDVCYLNCGRSEFRLPSCWGFPAMGNGKTMNEQKLFAVLTQRGGNRTCLVGVMRAREGICTGVSRA